MGKLYDPFEDLSDTITEDGLNITNLIRRYERHLRQNRDWLLKDAPRRTDLRIYEAVYHFTLYMYLANFLQHRRGYVFPEFPTGNGKIDLIIRYAGQIYGLELKTYTADFGYREALKQAARYGQQLSLREISLVFFVEAIDDTNREKYEAIYVDVSPKLSAICVRKNHVPRYPSYLRNRANHPKAADLLTEARKPIS